MKEPFDQSTRQALGPQPTEYLDFNAKQAIPKESVVLESCFAPDHGSRSPWSAKDGCKVVIGSKPRLRHILAVRCRTTKGLLRPSKRRTGTVDNRPDLISLSLHKYLPGIGSGEPILDLEDPVSRAAGRGFSILSNDSFQDIQQD